MKIRAKVQNQKGVHGVDVETEGVTHPLSIPPKASGQGSSINGGELLFLALATCYCNDLYREASRRGILVERVEVEVEGDFAAEGTPAQNITYCARVAAQAPEEDIRALIQDTDRMAEIQNTLRAGTPVLLTQVEALPTGPTS
jgi:organic hydroperoxide reductase OsmC/OhrA